MRVFTLLLVTCAISFSGLVALFRTMNSTRATRSSAAAGGSSGDDQFNFEHTWMSMATLRQKEKTETAELVTRTARSGEEKVSIVSCKIEGLLPMYYLRNNPLDPLRLTATQWHRLSLERKSAKESPGKTQVSAAAMNQYGTYLGISSTTTAENCLKSVLSECNDFKFAVPTEPIPTEPMPAHQPNQGVPQINEGHILSHCPLLQPAIDAILFQYKKRETSDFGNCNDEISVMCIVVCHELLHDRLTAGLRAFIRNHFPDTTDNDDELETTCLHLCAKYVKPHRKFWNAAFSATELRRGQLQQHKATEITEDRESSPYVSSMNKLQNLVDAQNHRSSSGEIKIKLGRGKPNYETKYKEIVGRIQSAVPRHGYEVVLEIMALATMANKVQLDSQIADGVLCPVINLPTSRGLVKDSIAEYALVSMWEFSAHIQRAKGKLYVSFDEGTKGRVKVLPVVVSCRVGNSDTAESKYRVVASIKGAGKTGVDANNVLTFIENQLNKLIVSQFGDAACPVIVLAMTLDGASDNIRLAKLRPQVTVIHCQMHINSLVLSNSFEPSFGAAHKQSQTNPSVISLLKNISYLIHDVIGMPAWKLLMADAKNRFDEKSKAISKDDFDLFGIVFNSEDFLEMWKELKNYDGCVMFTRYEAFLLITCTLASSQSSNSMN